MSNFVKGTKFKIISKKHNMVLHRAWEENVLLYRDENLIIGGNDKTFVIEADGRKWRTSEPALFYFNKDKWFNIVIVFDEEDYFYYCNVSSPYKWRENDLHYIDYDIDVIVQSNLSYSIVDEDEFKKNRYTYDYPEIVLNEVKNAISELQTMIKEREDPFNELFVKRWSDHFFNNDNE